MSSNKETLKQRAERLGIDIGVLAYYTYQLKLKTDEEILNQVKKSKQKKEEGTLAERAKRLGLGVPQLVYFIYKLGLESDQEIREYEPPPKGRRERRKRKENKQVVEFDTSGLKKNYVLQDIFLKLVEQHPEQFNLDSLFQRTAQINFRQKGRVLEYA